MTFPFLMALQLTAEQAASAACRPSHAAFRGYKQAMRGLRHLLLKQTAPEGGLLYVAELHSKSPFAKMDHLVCFLPGELTVNRQRKLLHCSNATWFSLNFGMSQDMGCCTWAAG